MLRGAQEPLELLFPGGDATEATQLYSDTPTARVLNGLLQRAVSSACAQLPAERGLRILEIGAGTGGTTAGLLPLLPADRSEYLFTDIGPTFLNKAQERFSVFPFVHYQPLNIEEAPAAQNLAHLQADLIVAANVLHATRNLEETLAHVRQLLQPGGQLLLDKGFYNISGMAWSGRGKVTRVDVSTDGGINWRQARLETPVLSKAVTRFNIDWVWDGKPAVLQSRAIDSTGYVQPKINQLRAVRGTRSVYHQNAIQSWRVAENGEVSNVQVY